jgi:hypothetical protein
MDQNQELDKLFAEYRAVMPDPEAGANFMPDLWRKIEARQFFLVRWKKLTQVFVAAAAAICLLLGIVLQAPSAKQNAAVSGTYVDVLYKANPTDNLTSVGIPVDYSEPTVR